MSPAHNSSKLVTAAGSTQPVPVGTTRHSTARSNPPVRISSRTTSSARWSRSGTGSTPTYTRTGRIPSAAAGSGKARDFLPLPANGVPVHR